MECGLGSKGSSLACEAREAIRVQVGQSELLLVCDWTKTEHWVRALRSAAATAPITVLSRSVDPRTAAAYREAGADDFVRLPKGACSLAAHLEMLRPSARAPEECASAGVYIELDATTYSVCVGCFRATLRPTSFELLAYLSVRLGDWVKSEELRERVLRPAAPHGSHVRWHVLEARSRLGPMSWWLHGDVRLGFMLSFAPCGRSHCRRRARSMAE